MIAEPSWPELTGARIYPDQPQGISRDDGEWVLGHKEFRYAVVPEHEGELVLPELTVQWWDTANDRQQTAVVPAHRLYVQPSALVPTAPEPAAPSPAVSPFAEPAPSGGAGAAWWRGLTLLFATLWLLTLVLFWRYRGLHQATARAARSADSEARGETELREQLRRACERGDAAAVRRSLLAWLRQFGPAGDSSLLGFAAGCGDPSLKQAVYALDAEGFKPAAGPVDGWDGRQFQQQFENWRQSWLAQKREKEPALTDLYAPANRSS